MRRRIGAIAAMALVAAGAFGGAAEAYPAPTGLGNSTTLCPPRSADASAAATSPEPLNGNPSLAAGGAATTGAAATGGGQATATILGAGGGAAYAEIDVQAASGTWLRAAYVSTTAQPAGQLVSQVVVLPPGPVRMIIENLGSSTQQVYYSLSMVSASAGESVLAQELSDACQLTVQDEASRHQDVVSAHQDATNAATAAATSETAALAAYSAAHNDAAAQLAATQQVDADVTAAKSAAHNDAGTLDSDLTAIHNDLVALKAATTGPSATSAQLVNFSTPDRVQLADAVSSLHNDLWVIVGVLVGCFAGAEVLRRVLS